MRAKKSTGGDSNAIWNGASGLAFDAADCGLLVAMVSLDVGRLRLPFAMGPPSAAQELRFLRDRARFLEDQLQQIRTRIADLKKVEQ